MTDIGEEHQSRMSQFEYLLVESLLLVVALGKLFVKTGLDEITAEHINSHHYDEHCKKYKSQGKEPLHMIG